MRSWRCIAGVFLGPQNSQAIEESKFPGLGKLCIFSGQVGVELPQLPYFSSLHIYIPSNSNISWTNTVCYYTCIPYTPGINKHIPHAPIPSASGFEMCLNTFSQGMWSTRACQNIHHVDSRSMTLHWCFQIVVPFFLYKADLYETHRWQCRSATSRCRKEEWGPTKLKPSTPRKKRVNLMVNFEGWMTWRYFPLRLVTW